MLVDLIKALGSIIKSTAKMLPNALSAPPPSNPPRLRVGLGGDIPVAPILAMILLVVAGFGLSYFTALQGSVIHKIFPNDYCIPVRAVCTALVAKIGTKLKTGSDEALAKAGTQAAFEPVPSIADSGPYATCRNPMYWALICLPASVGLACDNAWVWIGSTLLLWLYLERIVVPAEETFLQNELGDSYKKYCASVKRWGLF